MKFNEWFNSKLKVGRFPLSNEIINSKHDYFINVSDEYISYCFDAAMKSNKKYFWFPMNECIGDIGLNSIYGALQILYIAESENKSVYLHCHAGANRSPTVKAAYYFMRTGNHFVDDNYASSKNNRLIDNVNNGHLPAIFQLESFLNCCKIQFEKEETMRGGGIDTCKLKM